MTTNTHTDSNSTDHESTTKRTKFAPVAFETTGEGDTASPIGRYRVAHDAPVSTETIPHESCEHILVAGFPRRGQRSILTSLGMNLHREHGYSFIDIYDDGRMDTVETAIPNDDEAAKAELDSFDVEPAGMDTEVFVPDTGDLPDKLPANFRRFTIDIHDIPTEFKNNETLMDALRGTGVLSKPGAETALDMEAVVDDQARPAALCCSFLSPEQASLKYALTDLWLRLIYRAKDTNPRLPRVALGIRELKALAPSKLADAPNRDVVKELRKTAFKLSVQGGSRRIMLLGATTTYTHVYKPLRSNLSTKIVLQLGENGINSLDNQYDLSEAQKRALSRLNRGTGVLFTDGYLTWPVEFRPAPCGTGDGDRFWLDRYGEAVGARVRPTDGGDWEAEHADADWWVHTENGEVHSTDSPPNVGDYYSEWHLLSQDFADVLGDTPAPKDVDDDLVDTVLQARREFDMPAQLRLRRKDGVTTMPSTQQHD